MTNIIDNQLPEGDLARDCEAMAVLCLEQFFLKKTVNSIHHIDLVLEDLEDDFWGFTEVVHEDTRPRGFSISLNRRYYELSLEPSKSHLRELILKVVGHEMIHVRQFAKKELSSQIRAKGNSLKCVPIWKGKPWSSKKPYAHWFEPWEMEARAFEEPAFSIFLALNPSRANYYDTFGGVSVDVKAHD